MKTLDQQVSELLPEKLKADDGDKENVKRVAEGFSQAINLAHKKLKKMIREGKLTITPDPSIF